METAFRAKAAAAAAGRLFLQSLLREIPAFAGMTGDLRE